MHVLFDTNSLLYPVQFNVDVFTEAERLVQAEKPFLVLAQSIAELKSLARRKGKDGVAARVGLELAEKNCKVLESVHSKADDAILAIAKVNKTDLVVCTSDAGLKKRLKKAGVTVIGLMGKSHLGYC